MGAVRVAQVMGYMNGGGVESVVMNYYRHVDRSRMQFDFVVCEGSTLIPEEEIVRLGGRVFMVPSYSDVLGYRRALISLIHENEWQVVHSHMNTLSVFPLSAAKKAGVPVRIAHSHSTAGRGEHAKNVMKYALRPLANLYPTHRLACGQYAGKWLFGPNATFEVVRNAIDVGSFAFDGEARDCVRRELGVGEGQFLVGHMGRFMEQKNHEFLLRIFAALLACEPGSVLALAGDGPLFGQVKSLADELGISDSVRFLGRRSDAASLYSAFDVFCLPSLYEGLPMVGVECQASGTPILVSDAVTREAAMTSLMQFESLGSSPEAWANRLMSMRGLRPRGGDAERLSEFDIKTSARRLESIYSDALGKIEE